MEALDVSVLPGTARCDVEGFHLAIRQPTLQGARHELAAVVAAEVGRHPALGHQLFHDDDEISRRELAGDVEGETLAAVLVEHL